MAARRLADASMPCHCDERDLADYGAGLHKQIEKHWGDKVGAYFDKKQLLSTADSPAAILEKARAVDPVFGISFATPIPELRDRDVWYEMVNVCRGSFALASIAVPHAEYNYKPAEQKLAPFNTVFGNDKGKAMLVEVDRVSLHDAVLNVAVVWKSIWGKF
jgi:hypothetical protein